MQFAPLDTVIREAAEPHRLRGKEIHFGVAPDEGGDSQQPLIRRQPEIVHGLRNLAQNAVDFADGNVWIDAAWTADRIRIRISDDGQGYPPQVIGRLGDPFIRQRRSDSEPSKRPEYEGMGLGLFIAKTLLERTGATLRFFNGSDPFLTRSETPDRRGASVEVIWPRNRVATEQNAAIGALGENQRIEA